MKITTCLRHISHCKIAFGTSWSNRWTYRVFIIHTRRDSGRVAARGRRRLEARRVEGALGWIGRRLAVDWAAAEWIGRRMAMDRTAVGWIGRRLAVDRTAVGCIGRRLAVDRAAHVV